MWGSREDCWRGRRWASIVTLSPAAVAVTIVCFANLPLLRFLSDRDQPESQRTYCSGSGFTLWDKWTCVAHGVGCSEGCGFFFRTETLTPSAAWKIGCWQRAHIWVPLLELLLTHGNCLVWCPVPPRAVYVQSLVNLYYRGAPDLNSVPLEKSIQDLDHPCGTGWGLFAAALLSSSSLCPVCFPYSYRHCSRE